MESQSENTIVPTEGNDSKSKSVDPDQGPDERLLIFECLEPVGKYGDTILHGVEIPHTFLIGRIGLLRNKDFIKAFEDELNRCFAPTSRSECDHDTEVCSECEGEYYTRRLDKEYRDEKTDHFGSYHNYGRKLVSWHF